MFDYCKLIVVISSRHIENVLVYIGYLLVELFNRVLRADGFLHPFTVGIYEFSCLVVIFFDIYCAVFYKLFKVRGEANTFSLLNVAPICLFICVNLFRQFRDFTCCRRDPCRKLLKSGACDFLKSRNSFLDTIDVAYKFIEKDYIEDAIILPMAKNDDKISLVAHIVWSGVPSEDEQKELFEDLNALMREYLPPTFEMAAYSVHDIMLPYSPTTLKKDKNRLSKQTDGYVQVIDGQIQRIEFIPDDSGNYRLAVKN